MWVRIGPNNLQNQTCAQISLEGLDMVASSGRWNEKASHSQLWGQCSTYRHVLHMCFIVGISCIELPWLKIQEKSTPKAQKVFCTKFYPPVCQGGREDSLQTVGKKTFISSGPGLQRCCLCNSPGYNSECTQQRWQLEHSFMSQRRANSWNTDHMQRGGWVCVWMQTNTK